VRSNVSLAQASNEEVVLPERVQEALGVLVGSAKEGLLALSVGLGLGVLAELLEEEVVEVVGAKGKHDPERTAVRHGHEAGEVTLGGRRVAVKRPRVRSADGAAEVGLRTYEYFADRDPLSRVVLERMLAGVSTRRYRRTQEPVGSEVEARERSTSKSSVSRTLIERTRRSLARRADGPPPGRRLESKEGRSFGNKATHLLTVAEATRLRDALTAAIEAVHEVAPITITVSLTPDMVLDPDEWFPASQVKSVTPITE